MKRPLRTFAIVALAAAGSALLSGCPFSTDKGDPKPTPSIYRLRTEPENLMYNLKMAYLQRETAEYESLLAQDFEFFFSEEDQQIAEKLTRDEEIDIHRNMCTSDRVQSITLAFPEADLQEDVNKPDPKYPDRNLWTMVITNVDLELRATDDQGHSTTYRLEDGVEQYWFRQESWEIDGDPVWTIVQWKELTDMVP